MITRQVEGNIFTSGCQNIAFGINAQGNNTGGFAGTIANQYWRDLQYTPTLVLGETLHRASQGYTFHALVCHVTGPGGFDRTPTIITVCLDAIQLLNPQEEIACVLVGSGPMGRAAGANTGAILEGIQRSKKRVAVYSL